MPFLNKAAVPHGVQVEPVRRVAIIGAGAGGIISGATLAWLCVRAGFTVTLEDVLPSNLRKAAASLQILAQDFDTLPAPRYAISIEDAVRDADLILDTVPDELESKLEILSLLDRMAPPAALFVTPTEVLSIADLASCTYRAGQCFGLRFVSVALLHVTLSYPPAANPVAVARVQHFLEALNATTILHEDRKPLP